MRRDGTTSGELVRLLRKQTIPEPVRPDGTITVKGLMLPMVDDWYFTSKSGALRHRIHPAKLFPVTTGPLQPGRVLQGGSRVSVNSDGSCTVVFWDKDRTGEDQRWHTATSRDLTHWTITEKKPLSQSVRPHTPPLHKHKHSLAKTDKNLRFTPFLATATGKPTGLPAETFRFYDAKRDGPVDITQVKVKWVGLKDTFFGDIPAVARSAWPIWNKSKSEHLVLLHEPLMVDKP